MKKGCFMMNQDFYPSAMFPAGTNIGQSTDAPITNMSPYNSAITPSNPTGDPQSLSGSTLPGSQPPYAENILAMNRGKLATFYLSYSDSVEWRDKKFTGIIEDSGRDYALIKDPDSETRWLLWLVYLNYVEFDQQIEHN